MSVPLNPLGAALHAVVVQGGYSTPEIEAFRILDDALRQAKRGPLDDEWRQGVRDTLAWMDANPSHALTTERAQWQTLSRVPSNWREVLEEAAK